MDELDVGDLLREVDLELVQLVQALLDEVLELVVLLLEALPVAHVRRGLEVLLFDLAPEVRLLLGVARPRSGLPGAGPVAYF